MLMAFSYFLRNLGEYKFALLFPFTKKLVIEND